MRPTPDQIEKARKLAENEYSCTGVDPWTCDTCPIDCDTAVVRMAKQWLKDNGVEPDIR